MFGSGSFLNRYLKPQCLELSDVPAVCFRQACVALSQRSSDD